MIEEIIKSIIMGLVEGLTEFLPISSTGHLIIVGDLLNFLENSRREMFEVVIQLGAMLAVCCEYRHKLWQILRGLLVDMTAQRFASNIMVAFLPAVVLGLLFGSSIKAYLFSPIPVASAFIIGGLVIFWAERRNHRVTISNLEQISWKDALKVGIAQCFALIPGTSRSGATIIGALFFGFSRTAATEFSFFLAIPTLAAAAFYDLFKHRAALDLNMVGLLSIGFAVSFFSALVAVKSLLRYISRHDFTVFAWYRIAFGLIVLGTAHFGLVNWSH